MFEGVDTVVLQNELALEDELPFVWRPAPVPLAAHIHSRYFETNSRVLLACLALDDQPQVEKPEDQAQGAELARLDMKLNLLLDLVGRLLVQNQPRPTPAWVRFNAKGALWKPAVGDVAVKAGETGVFELYLHDCLDPLRLVGRVALSDAEGVEVRFDRGPDAITNLIDKLTFRRHRRRIADVRKR